MRLGLFLAGLILAVMMAPPVFAASDCEHTCCDKFSGSWDDDFDDCKHPKDGFDTCLSDCEAAVWAARPQGPGPASPENTYSCKVGALLAAITLAAFVARKN